MARVVFIPKIKRANFTSQSANVVPVIDDEKLVDVYIRDKVMMRNSHCISDWLFRRNDLTFDRQLLKKEYNKETS